MREIERRIRAGLLAYAAGDAAGVPWEGSSAKRIDPALIDQIPRHGDWPPGATSDDTALTLLVATYLADHGAVVDEYRFLTMLADAAPGIRGIGPSTQAAVDRFRATGALHAESGDTNGAAMRALPIGWAIADDDRRRAITVGLSKTTHGAPAAVAAACVASAMASATVDERSALAAAHRELAWCHTAFGDVLTTARAAAEDRWTPHPRGVPLDAAQTIAAVVAVVRHAADARLGVADALRHAVLLGGDTDTVAAIAGGVLGPLEPAVDIPWLLRVDLPPAELIDGVAVALAALRASPPG